MSNLTHLANALDSDKGTKGGRSPHRYTYIYDLLFYPLKDKRISFLEIGLCRGGPELGGNVDRKANSPSVEMWKEYFSCATITGFDISDFSHQQDARFTFVRGDSGSRQDMERLARTKSHYDVIIEDASHASYHQQMAILCLWDKVTRGGLFIIEDLNWQPPVFEDQLPRVPTTVELLWNLFEGDASLESILCSRHFLQRIKEETQAASFFPQFEAYKSSKIKLVVLVKR